MWHIYQSKILEIMTKALRFPPLIPAVAIEKVIYRHGNERVVPARTEYP